MALACKRVYGELGTVYAQCGGIFGISAFADRCMDKWMADPMLNANEAVATWHAKAQRCGFKFLVVQIMGQLTGGPQRYTGRSIDEAHKHLNISSAEWERFMEIFNEVCTEFQLGDELVGDLNALMISMEFECVVQDGEVAPRNPGPALPRGNSLYARCGGVYPISLFVDRLVDALIQDERVQIPCDGQKRNEASLKYLFTEVMCSITGGPEVITSKDMAETKLLLPKGAWEIFIATTQIAADHFPMGARAEIVQCLQRNKAMIVDPNSDAATVPVLSGNSVNVKSIQAAASGRMLLSSAAIAARHAAPGAHVDARRRVIGDPRTLYGRGGGVFGLAKLADTLMEAWMADPVLNANTSVAKWHTSQQKYGFKFLVTQLLGYLTGGPQRYTGVAMDIAHKHLGISGNEWNNFIAVAERVFHELGVNAGTQAELQAILASFKDQIVVQNGEPVPEDPGMCRARPNGNAAYTQLGGVYPIALFADRLVERVLQGDRVQVQWNAVMDASGVRHPPGLKYMVTELLCHSAGGPELPTSKGFDDAKLGVDPDQWSNFLEIVAEAATVWPTKHHRDMILKICERSRAEICFGLEGQDMPDLEMAVATDPNKTAQAFAIPSEGCCPFSGKAGGKCPFSGGQADVTQTLAKAHVATTQHQDTIIKRPSGLPSAPMTVRLLGDVSQQKLDKLLVEDPDHLCPVSLMVFHHPVVASDGFIYEEASLQQLLANRQVSPMTREVLKPTYRFAEKKQAEVLAFRSQRSEELLAFAQAELEAATQQQGLALAALERIAEYLADIHTAPAQAIKARAAQTYSQLGRAAPTALQEPEVSGHWASSWSSLLFK
jgi:hemoglobin